MNKTYEQIEHEIKHSKKQDPTKEQLKALKEFKETCVLPKREPKIPTTRKDLYYD